MQRTQLQFDRDSMDQARTSIASFVTTSVAVADVGVSEVDPSATSSDALGHEVHAEWFISPNPDPNGLYLDLRAQGYTPADYRRWDSFEPLRYAPSAASVMVRNAAFPTTGASTFDTNYMKLFTATHQTVYNAIGVTNFRGFGMSNYDLIQHAQFKQNNIAHIEMV